MPYRRLPTTDQARLRALRTALKQAEGQNYTNQVLSFKIISELQSYLPVFESKLTHYQQTTDDLIDENKRCQQLVSNARLYISHFIQVLNLAVIRGEIKREHKRYYNLDPDSNSIPDMDSDNTLLEWGNLIIQGELERTRNNGLPIYNPAIGKVQVHYDLFKELKQTQKMRQLAARRASDDLAAFRGKGDNIILEIWNQIEAKFQHLEPNERMEECQKYGIVYYYRRGEKPLNSTDDEEQDETGQENINSDNQESERNDTKALQSTLFFP
ncbi:MAG: hypothetical protein LBV75_05065 [Paludibacter sp.]|jgi:hypothetical protein|nr:hypothetical protein [Paludibacter sp.]